MFILESLEIRTAPSHHGALAHAFASVHHRDLTPQVEVSTFNRTETNHAAETASSPDTGSDSQNDPNSGSGQSHTESPDGPASHR
jgi:hypothetical protein